MADITFFYQKDENGQVVLDDDNNPVLMSRGQTTSLDELKAMIRTGRPQRAIDAHIQFVANGLNWAKYDEWAKLNSDYGSEMVKYNEDLERYNTATTEERETMTAPTQPEKPAALSFNETTAEQVSKMLETDLKASKRKQRDEEIAKTVVYLDGIDPANPTEKIGIDADERSRSLMLEAANMLVEYNQSEIDWKCNDNIWRKLTASQLKQAIMLGGQQQIEIMKRYE